MKNTYSFPQISLLLFLMVFITSCKGGEKSTLSKGEQLSNEQPSVPYPHSDSQIAEYIRHIYQDKNGNFWFGTNKYGIAHFDGESISYFSLEQGFGGTQITGIAEDLEKNIWFATNDGAVKYDWSTTINGEKSFTNYPVKKYAKTHLWSIFSDSKGNIWAGHRDGVLHFNGTNWEPFGLPYSEEEVSGFVTNRTNWSIMEDKKGNLWFGTNGNGAFKYDPEAIGTGGKSFIQYTVKDGLPDNSVCRIIEDSKGNIWFGTWYGGLSNFNGETFTNYTAKDSIGNNEVSNVYEDKLGNIWLSSEGYGVYRFDGKSFSNYTEKQGLGVKAVQAIYEDQEGRLWVGGGGGLYRFIENSFINVTKNGPWE